MLTLHRRQSKPVTIPEHTPTLPKACQMRNLNHVLHSSCREDGSLHPTPVTFRALYSQGLDVTRQAFISGKHITLFSEAFCLCVGVFFNDVIYRNIRHCWRSFRKFLWRYNKRLGVDIADIWKMLGYFILHYMYIHQLIFVVFEWNSRIWMRDPPLPTNA